LGRNGSNRLILTLRHSLGDSAACSADTHGSLPDTPCSAPCYSCGQSIRQHTELFGLCRPERGENRAQIANLPVFLPVTRVRPPRRPVSQDCAHHQPPRRSGALWVVGGSPRHIRGLPPEILPIGGLWGHFSLWPPLLASSVSGSGINFRGGRKAGKERTSSRLKETARKRG